MTLSDATSRLAAIGWAITTDALAAKIRGASGN